MIRNWWLGRKRVRQRKSVTYTIIEQTEHRSLIEVSSNCGTFLYWIPNRPISDYLFTTPRRTGGQR